MTIPQCERIHCENTTNKHNCISDSFNLPFLASLPHHLFYNGRTSCPHNLSIVMWHYLTIHLVFTSFQLGTSARGHARSMHSLCTFFTLSLHAPCTLCACYVHAPCTLRERSVQSQICFAVRFGFVRVVVMIFVTTWIWGFVYLCICGFVDLLISGFVDCGFVDL